MLAFHLRGCPPNDVREEERAVVAFLEGAGSKESPEAPVGTDLASAPHQKEGIR